MVSWLSYKCVRRFLYQHHLHYCFQVLLVVTPPMANDSHELTSVNKEFFPLLSPINTVQSILWVPLDLPTPGH